MTPIDKETDIEILRDRLKKCTAAYIAKEKEAELFIGLLNGMKRMLGGAKEQGPGSTPGPSNPHV